MRMLPPMSVPNPAGEPRRPINAPSPPELPPEHKRRFFGLYVYPMMLLTVSPLIKVCGTLVLTYNTAPRALSSRTISLSCVPFRGSSFLPWNVPIQPTYPMLVSTFLTWNWSFKLIGTPCRGPTVFLFFTRYSSSALASESAASKKVSCKQLVYLCQHTTDRC